MSVEYEHNVEFRRVVLGSPQVEIENPRCGNDTPIMNLETGLQIAHCQNIVLSGQTVEKTKNKYRNVGDKIRRSFHFRRSILHFR